jgi:hypothetical protein
MRTRRVLAALLLLLAVGACGGDDGTGLEEEETQESLVGRYNLVTVNGDTLPVLLRDDSVRVTITSGYYNLNIDETFTFGFSYQVTRGGATTSEADSGFGFWFQNNDAVLFDYGEEDIPDAATVAGRYMYMTVFLASPFVFLRQ